MKLILQIACLVLFATSSLLSQSFDTKFIVGEYNEKTRLFTVTNDNTILVANTLVDSTNSDGNLQIVRLNFDGDVLNKFKFQDSIIGKAYDVVQTDEGDVFLLAFKKNSIVQIESTLELYKLNYDLEPIWGKTIINNTYDPFGTLVLFEDKLMINLKFPDTNRLMLDFDGNTLWETDTTLTSKEYLINSAHKKDEGNVVVLGSIGDVQNSNGGIYLISDSGELQWEKEVVDTFNTQFIGLTTTADEIFVTGLQRDDAWNHYASLTKFTSEGDLIFHKTIDNFGYLVGRDVLVQDEHIFLLCTTDVSIHDIMLIILDLDGNEISRFNLGDNRNNTAHKIESLNADSLVIVGWGVSEQPTVNQDMKYIVISELNTITNTKDIIKNNQVFIYPNPIHSGSKLRISEQIKEGTLYDLLGTKHIYISDTNEINTHNIPPGIYFLQATTHNLEALSTKIIIQD